MAKQQTEKPAERTDSRFKGVRKRKWGKYVSEIRLPNSRERIWLGSYDSAEKAARAFDAALFCLRGRSAKFNFPENPPDIAGGPSLTPTEIQSAATKFANSAPETAQSYPSPLSVSPSLTASPYQSSSPSQSAADGSTWNPDNSVESSYDDLNLDAFPECDAFFDDLDSNYLPEAGYNEEFLEGMLNHDLFLWNF